MPYELTFKMGDGTEIVSDYYRSDSNVVTVVSKAPNRVAKFIKQGWYTRSYETNKGGHVDNEYRGANTGEPIETRSTRYFDLIRRSAGKEIFGGGRFYIAYGPEEFFNIGVCTYPVVKIILDTLNPSTETEELYSPSLDATLKMTKRDTRNGVNANSKVLVESSAVAISTDFTPITYP